MRVALLLVAVRRQALTPGVDSQGRLSHARTIARIATAISGDSEDFASALPGFPARTAKQQPITARLRTRRQPWQRSTPSWPAAYNLACAYAALAASKDPMTELDPLVTKMVNSLEFAVCNPECELDRPSSGSATTRTSAGWSGRKTSASWRSSTSSATETTQPTASRRGPIAGLYRLPSLRLRM